MVLDESEIALIRNFGQEFMPFASISPINMEMNFWQSEQKQITAAHKQIHQITIYRYSRVFLVSQLIFRQFLVKKLDI